MATQITVCEHADHPNAWIVTAGDKNTNLTVNSGSSANWVRASQAMVKYGNLQASVNMGVVALFRNVSATSDETLIVDSSTDCELSAVESTLI